MEALTVAVIALWVAMAVLVVCFYSVVRRMREVLSQVRQQGAFVEEGLPRGTPAPEFSERTASGEEVSLQSLAGRRIALLFTSHTCSACERLVKELLEQRAQLAEFGDSLVLVNSGPKEPDSNWPGWRLQHVIKVVPRSEMFRMYRVQGLPRLTTIISGRVEGHRPLWSWQDVLQELRASLETVDVA